MQIDKNNLPQINRPVGDFYVVLRCEVFHEFSVDLIEAQTADGNHRTTAHSQFILTDMLRMGKIDDVSPVAEDKCGFGKHRFHLAELELGFHGFTAQNKPGPPVKGFHKLNLRNGGPVLSLESRQQYLFFACHLL